MEIKWRTLIRSALCRYCRWKGNFPFLFFPYFTLKSQLCWFEFLPTIPYEFETMSKHQKTGRCGVVLTLVCCRFDIVCLRKMKVKLQRLHLRVHRTRCLSLNYSVNIQCLPYLHGRHIALKHNTPCDVAWIPNCRNMRRRRNHKALSTKHVRKQTRSTPAMTRATDIGLTGNAKKHQCQFLQRSIPV